MDEDWLKWKLDWMNHWDAELDCSMGCDYLSDVRYDQSSDG